MALIRLQPLGPLPDIKREIAPDTGSPDFVLGNTTARIWTGAPLRASDCVNLPTLGDPYWPFQNYSYFPDGVTYQDPTAMVAGWNNLTGVAPDWNESIWLPASFHGKQGTLHRRPRSVVISVSGNFLATGEGLAHFQSAVASLLPALDAAGVSIIWLGWDELQAIASLFPEDVTQTVEIVVGTGPITLPFPYNRPTPANYLGGESIFFTQMLDSGYTFNDVGTYIPQTDRIDLDTAVWQEMKARFGRVALRMGVFSSIFTVGAQHVASKALADAQALAMGDAAADEGGFDTASVKAWIAAIPAHIATFYGL